MTTKSMQELSDGAATRRAAARALSVIQVMSFAAIDADGGALTPRNSDYLQVAARALADDLRGRDDWSDDLSLLKALSLVESVDLALWNVGQLNEERFPFPKRQAVIDTLQLAAEHLREYLRTTEPALKAA